LNQAKYSQPHLGHWGKEIDMEYQKMMDMKPEELLTAVFLGVQGINFLPLIPFFDCILPIETWLSGHDRYGIFKMNDDTGILCWSSGYSRGEELLLINDGKPVAGFSSVGHLHGCGDKDFESHLAQEIVTTCKIFHINTLYKYGGHFDGLKNIEGLTVKNAYGDIKNLYTRRILGDGLIYTNVFHDLEQKPVTIG